MGGLIARRACFSDRVLDCHSTETVWPWYAGGAPVSWLIQRDVDEGRRTLYFSECDRPLKEARESAETVRKGEMPPWLYAGVRRRASLTPAETKALIRGLEATLGRTPPERSKRGDRR